MKEIKTVNISNIDNEHICCALGKSKEDIFKEKSKKDWLRKCFAEGLIFKKLDVRGKVFIEYTPAENAWKPVIAPNHYLINCLWVSGRYKNQGYAKQLLNECISDAEKQGKDGIVYVAASKKTTFLTDKNFFIKHGFITCDTAYPDFELLVYKINNVDKAFFTEKAKKNTIENEKGASIIYSNQCPYAEFYTKVVVDAFEKKGISVKLIKLSNCKNAQNSPSPFGTNGIYLDGNFLTHKILTEKELYKLLNKN